MGKPVTTYLIEGNAGETTKVCTILSINYKHK